MATITLLASLFSIILTIAILWSNPHRFTNQVFALATLVEAVWLGCIYRAKQIGTSTNAGAILELEFWQRANAASIAFLPAIIWLLKSSITSPPQQKRKAIASAIPIFALCAACASLCYSRSFIYQTSSNELSRGSAYYVYISVEFSIYVACLVHILKNVRTQNGIRRIELQFLALNAGGAALLALSLNALGNFLNKRHLNQSAVVLTLLPSAITAWALFSQRVFNTRQVISELAQRLALGIVLSIGVYGTWKLVNTRLVEPFDLLFSIGFSSMVSLWIDRKLRSSFDSAEKESIKSIRHEIIETANREAETDKLAASFSQILQNAFRSEFTYLLPEKSGTYQVLDFSLTKGQSEYIALHSLTWATPESLERRRPTDDSLTLLRLIEQHSIKLIITAPRHSATPSLIVALGPRVDGWPFTYPEVERLQNIAELMDNILTRSRLIAQAALQARIDHLAMMSRGLAHDLKNLITPVSSFLVHTDTHFPPTSPEGEVHAAARRSVRIMTDYVREALLFSERMEPHFESVNLAQIFTGMRQVTETRAKRRGVTVEIKDDFHAPLTADRVLLQRLLANLVSNAIDASATGQSVLLSADTASPGRLRLQVIDQGTGIPPENVARVFDPYFTTKDLGDDMRGFGLGLTICQKIATLHQGTIALQSSPRRGTRVTVELPTVQSKLRELRPPALDSPLESPAIG